MSKNSGSITPRTERNKIDFPLVPGEPERISDYYNSRFQAQYVQGNQDRQEAERKGNHNVRTLDELSKYCDSGPLRGLKSQFSKATDSMLKTSGVLGVIRPDQIVAPLEFVKIFQHREDVRVTDFDPLKPTVRHYGINSANGAVFIGHIVEEEKLHPVEVSVFSKALDYLRRQCSAEEYIGIRSDDLSLPKPNNVVLVSFFPRKLEVDRLLKAKIIVADKNFPTEVETHTIVLWKTGPREITVIDPSDRTYSQFLVKVFNKDETCPYTFKMEDSVVEGVEGKIYRPLWGLDKLLKLKLERDCTDIAVKIAFELNERQTDLLIPSVELALTNAIEQISNVNLPKEVGLFRAPQASDNNVRIAASVLVHKAKEKLKNDAVLKVLDITKIESLDQIEEVCHLIGELNTDLLM